MTSKPLRMVVALCLVAIGFAAVTAPVMSAQDPKKTEEARKKKEAEDKAAAERREADRKAREAAEKQAEDEQSERVKRLLERKRREVSAGEAAHGSGETKSEAKAAGGDKPIEITDAARAEAAKLSATRTLADAVKTPEGKLFNPFTDNKEAIAQGKQLYLDYSCNGCHGGGGGGGMCPPLTNERFVYGSDDDTIFRLIALGSKELGRKRIAKETVVGPMPGYLEIIEKEEELWKIIAFVRSVYRGRAKKRDW
ncbi:MAG: c-type cytochrome [Filomicrobium sp.]